MGWFYGESASVAADKVEFAERYLWVQQAIASHRLDPLVKLEQLAVSAF
jgi:hypothetical protein